MNLDDALQTFIAESRELLEEMENALLNVDLAGDQDEAINAIFRAAHTIKGSAGLFSLDHIVAFTHVLENVLDRVRGGHQVLEPGLMELALRCSDHVGALLDVVTTTGDDKQLDFIADRLLCRPLRPAERKIIQGTLQSLLTDYTAKPDDAKALIAVGESKADPTLESPKLAAWTMIASEMMNLDEVLNK